MTDALPALVLDEASECLARLMEILAPGENDLVAFLEAYFDESGSHDGSPGLSVAGYLFDKESCQLLDAEWKAVLDKFNLPYFHMVDCAHGNYPFDSLSKEERIDCEIHLIHIIRKRMIKGMVCTVNTNEYNKWPVRDIVGDAYTYCCWQILAGVRKWMDENNFNGYVAYFFEAGHVHQQQADRVMTKVFSNPILRERYRYAAHSFVRKALVRPVQAPDILAWLHFNLLSKIQKGINRPRKDLVALVEGKNYEVLMINDRVMEGLIKFAERLRFTDNPAGLYISGYFGSIHFRFPMN